MKFADRIKSAGNLLLGRNAIGDDLRLSRHYLKYGNRRPMVQDWSQILARPEDLYTGYLYGAISRRANRVAQLASYNLKTDATQPIMDAAKKAEKEVEHPYIELIDKSTDFSNSQFWSIISTFLDLKGVFYILVVRNFSETRYGNIQEFKLLNPYEIKRVINDQTGEVGGYAEQRGTFYREIPPQMIIEIRPLNPFSRDDPLSMTDAAKDSQFTLKQAGDYTRSSLRSNQGAPGIISTDEEMPPEEFENFRSRILNQEKGEPLFGNGAGAVKFESMQTDLDKASLDKVAAVSVENLIAVTGVSKTMLGIEQSGITRETGKVQSDLFVTQHIIPQLQMIIDALNQDYKNAYPDEYKRNEYQLYIDNPLGSDRDAELKDIEIREVGYELFNSLINKGYDNEIAAKFAEGQITLEELGEPKNPPILPVQPVAPEEPPPPPAEQKLPEVHEHKHEETHDPHVEGVSNLFDEESQGILNQQQGALQNAVVNIEEQVVVGVLNRITRAKNQFDEKSDIITKTDRQNYERELEVALAAFYSIILPLYARRVLSRRLQEFGLQANFALSAGIKRYIKATASKAASGHIDTILGDLLATVREQALEGASQQELISAIRKKYTSEISTTRAKTIARTETNRAFTRSQYEADWQFIQQNQLEGRVFKKWITRSGNPCPLCQAKAEEAPIPFDRPFAELGDEITATYEEDGKTKVLKQKIGFETVEAGNLHPNCSCIYQLIVE